MLFQFGNLLKKLARQGMRIVYRAQKTQYFTPQPSPSTGEMKICWELPIPCFRARPFPTAYTTTPSFPNACRPTIGVITIPRPIIGKAVRYRSVFSPACESLRESSPGSSRTSNSAKLMNHNQSSAVDYDVEYQNCSRC